MILRCQFPIKYVLRLFDYRLLPGFEGNNVKVNIAIFILTETKIFTRDILVFGDIGLRLIMRIVARVLAREQAGVVENGDFQCLRSPYLHHSLKKLCQSL